MVSTIITHVNNFANTWEGWLRVLGNFNFAVTMVENLLGWAEKVITSPAPKTAQALSSVS